MMTMVRASLDAVSHRSRTDCCVEAKLRCGFSFCNADLFHINFVFRGKKSNKHERTLLC